MPDKYFNNNYVSYWKERVDNLMDGSKVADENISDFYIRQLNILEDDKILDLGCGFGRLYKTISKYSQRIVGIDISHDMLVAASKFPYDCLFEASAEKTLAADNSFDHIVIWFAYDALNQEKSLVEFNRILKNGGRILLTGKNYSYDPVDELAFIAERNAKLKDFPNHFTDVLALRNSIEMYGFKINKAYAFQRRGDLGENKYIDISDRDLDPFYEFVLILEKTGRPVNDAPFFAHEFSKVAEMYSKTAGYDDVRKFFTAEASS